MILRSITLSFAALSLFCPTAVAQSNAEADLCLVGDTLGDPLTAEVMGSVSHAVTYLETTSQRVARDRLQRRSRA